MSLEFREKVYIYGSGTFAQKVANALPESLINGCMDYNPRFTKFMEWDIISPEAIPSTERPNVTICIGVHNRAVNMAELIDTLRELGYISIHTPLNLSGVLGIESYWLTPLNKIDMHSLDIPVVGDMFYDKRSHDLFYTLFTFYITGDYHSLSLPDYNQYDMPWENPIRLMDYGAYNGDTIHSLLYYGHEIEAVAAFEPDPENFKKLVELCDYIHIPETYLWPCGVYSDNMQVKYSSGNGEACSISPDGTSIIQCVVPDQVASTFAPTLIKMDIEGAEAEALQGSRELIKKYHPGLAICVYHKPNDLWEIPMQVKKMADEFGIKYNYFLRSYGHSAFETVFYAIPVKE